MTDFNRQELIDTYISCVLENMSTKEMMQIVGDVIEENLSLFSDEELINEVAEYHPELLKSE